MSGNARKRCVKVFKNNMMTEIVKTDRLITIKSVILSKSLNICQPLIRVKPIYIYI